MRNLEMTDSEIVKSYENAIDPRVQINILAELNCTNKATICKVLKRNGVVIPPEPKKNHKGGRPRKYRIEEDVEAPIVGTPTGEEKGQIKAAWREKCEPYTATSF